MKMLNVVQLFNWVFVVTVHNIAIVVNVRKYHFETDLLKSMYSGYSPVKRVIKITVQFSLNYDIFSQI